MDLRSIINSDTSTTTPIRPKSSQSPPGSQEYHSLAHGFRNPYDTPVPNFHTQHDIRSPQPPPLQPPAHNDLQLSSRSSSYSSVQTPYQPTPSSSLSGNQYPFPSHISQSPGRSSQPLQYLQRESPTMVTSTSYTSLSQATALPHTPINSVQNHSHSSIQQRPPSSSSSTTPNYTQSHFSSMLKEIPNPAQARMSAPLATYPTQNQHSLPGTPLGPPSTFGRLSSGLQREIPGPGDQQRSFSDSSHSRQQKAAPSPGRESSGSWAASPTVYGPRHSQSITETYASDHDRERSLSVSPKTRLPSQGNSEAMDITQNTPHENNGQVTPVKREETVDALENPNSDQPNAIRGQDGPASRVVDGTLNPPQSNQQSAASYGYAPDQRQESLSSHSPTPIPLSRPFHFTANSDQSTSQGLPTPGSSSATPSRPQPSTPRLPSNHQIPPLQSTPTSPDAMHTPSGVTTIAPPTPATQHIVAGQQSTNPAGLIGLPEQPKRKRKRYDEIPMFARKASRTNPTVPADPQPAPQFPRPVKQKSPSAKHRSSQSPPQHPSIRSSNANGHSAPKNEVLLPQVQRGFANQGSLGPWEPSILNTAPLDDVTHSLSEILFNEVVRRDDVGPGSAVGGVGGVGRGAVLEIEAKIGQLIDRNTNDRIRLPVMSECIVSKGDPNLRVNFKSSMTESQHRSMNGFLNKALLDSQPSKSDSSANPRIPMTYVHTRECDSFYDLSQAGLLSLPASIRNQLDQRHPRVKVRITTDQKTGKVLAKIVKARVTDVDVYSPRTPFDWRVSVNLEMDWDGDMKDLVESKNGQKRADRNKDRVSYRHQSYQIDLTQVTPSDTSSKPEKEHELEVEVSSSEVRKQGLLFKNNQANRYNDLIRGFVDNVRTLARHCHV